MGVGALLPVFQIGELIAERADATFRQKAAHAIQERMPHARAGSVPEDVDHAAPVGHGQYRRDLPPGFRDVKLQLRHLRQLLHLFVPKAPDQVIVDHAGCLQERVAGGRPDEPEAATLQFLAHAVRRRRTRRQLLQGSPLVLPRRSPHHSPDVGVE